MFSSKVHAFVTIGLLWLLAGCGLPATERQPDASAPPATVAEPTATTATTEPTEAASEAAATNQPSQPEAIAIGRPGSGSTVSSPLSVRGVADPAFEQNLGLRLYRMTGELLAEGSATIEAPIGQRGPFSGELSFEVEEGGPAVLQVFNSSARDGGLTHLSSVSLRLSPQGQAQIEEAPVGPESINIHEPQAGAALSGGVVQVSGVGRASFEGTLVVEIVNADGETVGQQPLIVEAPAMGEPGPFSAEVSYQVESAQPGRVLVYDPSPAFGGMVHLSSVEVQLQP